MWNYTCFTSDTVCVSACEEKHMWSACGNAILIVGEIVVINVLTEFKYDLGDKSEVFI